jgi:uncharacterized protein YndB with AHSA1/START domain
MNKGTSSTVTPPADRTLTTTRVFDAPRELVYRAWTDQRQLALWFPPEHFTAPVCQLDVRPGGSLRIDMKGDDDAGDFAGVVFPAVGVYREVVPNERLAFTLKGLEEGPPPMVLTTVIFEDQGRRTKVTIHQTADTIADYEVLLKIGATEGLRQSLDKLSALLERKAPDTTVSVTGRSLSITRIFDAPRELVWKAYTDPAQIVKWMFSNDWESPFAETDLRPGGRFRIGMRPADHSEEGFVFDGTYREVVRPERIVQVIGDGRVMKTTFDDVGGKTRLSLTVEMSQGEEQERQGWTQIMEHLAAHVATLSGRAK